MSPLPFSSHLFKKYVERNGKTYKIHNTYNSKKEAGRKGRALKNRGRATKYLVVEKKVKDMISKTRTIYGLYIY